MQPIVIVPTFNEADNIEQLVTRLTAVEPAVDVVVVDDASPDSTGGIADRLALNHQVRVSMIHRGRKGGRGAAVMAGLAQGFRDGKYDGFAEMDADLSHLPEELCRLLAASESVDMVSGSRYVPRGRDHWLVGPTPGHRIRLGPDWPGLGELLHLARTAWPRLTGGEPLLAAVLRSRSVSRGALAAWAVAHEGLNVTTGMGGQLSPMTAARMPVVRAAYA